MTEPPKGDWPILVGETFVSYDAETQTIVYFQSDKWTEFCLATAEKIEHPLETTALQSLPVRTPLNNTAK